jgi:hypothetical protein
VCPLEPTRAPLVGSIAVSDPHEGAAAAWALETFKLGAAFLLGIVAIWAKETIVDRRALRRKQWAFREALVDETVLGDFRRLEWIRDQVRAVLSSQNFLRCRPAQPLPCRALRRYGLPNRRCRLSTSLRRPGLAS